MSGLLYKNFRINRSSMIFTLVTAILCGLTLIFMALFGYMLRGMTPSPEEVPSLLTACSACYFLAFWLPSMASATLFQADENKTCCAFAMSLPQGAKGHVEAKYYYLLIQALGILFITFITDTILTAMLGGTVSTTSVLPFMFSLHLFLAAVEIPFMIRFGADRGLQIKGGVVLAVFAMAALYFLFGDISWFIENEDDPLGAFMAWLGSGDIIFWLALFPYISIAAYYISCKISVKIYRKGAESYEQ